MTITPIVTMFQTLTNTKMPQWQTVSTKCKTNCFQQQRFTLFKILTPTVPQDSNINSFLPPNRLYPKQRHKDILNLLTLNCHLTLLLLCPYSPPLSDT